MKRAFTCVIAILACGCTTERWGPEELGRGHISSTERTAELGRNVYASYCVGCHGEEGDGEGPAARFLDPKPRDLRLGKLKFAGVTSGEPPRDEDYLRTIEHGLQGTAMPSFALLTLRERVAVVAYVREFVDPKKRKTPGTALALTEDPWAKDPEGGVAAGKIIYHTDAKCWSCHPSYATSAELASFGKGGTRVEVRNDPGTPLLTESAWGAPIRAPDFLVERVKNGIEVGDLVRVIQAGVGGTAMPTWAGALKPKELWGLAHYIHSLALRRGTPDVIAARRLAAAEKKVQP